MKRLSLLLIVSALIAGTAEARQTRNITIEITRPSLGDTYDILVAPRGQPLVKVVTASYSLPSVVVPNLVVGRTYDFTCIVWRGLLRSVQPPPLHYTITRASGQRLLGVAPP